MASTISVRGEPERVKLVGRALEPDYLLLYIFLHLRSKTWTHVPSGRSRQRGRMCIIGHTLLRIVRCCIWLTRLTLVCEVIRYRLAQVRKNLKKKKKKKKRLRVGGPQSSFSISSSVFLFRLRLTTFNNTRLTIFNKINIFKSTPNDNGRLLKFAIEISFEPAHQWRNGLSIRSYTMEKVFIR